LTPVQFWCTVLVVSRNTAPEVTMSATPATLDATHVCHAACVNATREECTCVCGGLFHGVEYQAKATAARETAAARTAAVYGDSWNSLRVGGGLAEDDWTF
jgi:hypothetical protein